MTIVLYVVYSVVQLISLNPLPTNDIYMSYSTANIQTLDFKYLSNKYAY
jgi:hypothetical protein